MQVVLSNPKTIDEEAGRLRRNDPTAIDRKALARRLAEIVRQHSNIARRAGAIDDDETVAVLLVELGAFSKQAAALKTEREELDGERASWEAAQHRLDDLEA